MNDMMVNNDKTMDTDITTDRVTAGPGTDGPGTDGRSGTAAAGMLARLPTPCLVVGLAPATDRRGLAP